MEIVEKTYDGRIPPLKSLLELFSLEKKYDDVPGFSLQSISYLYIFTLLDREILGNLEVQIM